MAYLIHHPPVVGHDGNMLFEASETRLQGENAQAAIGSRSVGKMLPTQMIRVERHPHPYELGPSGN